MKKFLVCLLLGCLLVFAFSSCAEKQEKPSPSPESTPKTTLETSPTPEPTPDSTPEPTPEPEATPEPATPEPTPSTPAVNIIGDMSDKEYKDLNIFFSNFSELYFSDFDIENFEDSQIIKFAIWHNYINNEKSFSYENEKAKMSKATIDSTIDRFFGISDVKHATIDAHQTYENDYWYFDPADGEAFAWSQVLEFYDNGDGTFTAIMQNLIAGDIIDSPYGQRKKWEEGGKYDIYFDGYYSATVAPQEYNGRKTYKLLKYTKQ